MTVLIIMGIVIALLAVILFANYLNEYSERHFSYTLFSYEQFSLVSLPTVALYFGNELYTTTLKTHGDILNGIIVMSIATAVLLFAIYRNLKYTNILFGLFATTIQFAIFMPLSFLALLGLLGALAFFAQTKPVYGINSCSRDD